MSDIYGTTVYVKHDNVEQAIRKLKKKVQELGTLQEAKDREAYEKPTVSRKKKKAAAKQRLRRQLASQELPKKLY